MLNPVQGSETRSLVQESESCDHGTPEVSSAATRRKLIVASLLLAGCVCLVGALGADESNARHKLAKPLRQLTLKSRGPPPPKTAGEYNSLSWPAMTVPGTEEMHIFAIGDWGGLDGVIQPATQKDKMIMYKGGETLGPHVFAHRPGSCPDQDMMHCFDSLYLKQYPAGCNPVCAFKPDVDLKPQLLVADQLKARAKIHDPKLVLNVGDNFYYGGIPLPCGSPMGELTGMAGEMFDEIFNKIYAGPGLDGKPWLSVLGNHDYGGWLFTNAWDQQIAYTWHSDRWLMPAQYFMQHVDFPDQGISMDILMLDSNSQDAAAPDVDAIQNKNICSRLHNHPDASCAAAGGPSSVDECSPWFANLWVEQQKWTEKKLAASGADWQIIVTHFPCGHASSWYKMLHSELGLDLLVTGHTHVQQVFEPGGALGGLMCFITGGGGGILSESSPMDNNTNAYGFFDITVTQEFLRLESINVLGNSLGKWTIGNAGPATKASARRHAHGHGGEGDSTDEKVFDKGAIPTAMPKGSFWSFFR